MSSALAHAAGGLRTAPFAATNGPGRSHKAESLAALRLSLRRGATACTFDLNGNTFLIHHIVNDVFWGRLSALERKRSDYGCGIALYEDAGHRQ